MKPTRVLPPLGSLNHDDRRTHCNNIARIISEAESIADADCRIGYYLAVVGVTYCEPADKTFTTAEYLRNRRGPQPDPVTGICPGPEFWDGQDVPAKLAPAAVDAVLSQP